MLCVMGKARQTRTTTIWKESFFAQGTDMSTGCQAEWLRDKAVSDCFSREDTVVVLEESSLKALSALVV